MAVYNAKAWRIVIHNNCLICLTDSESTITDYTCFEFDTREQAIEYLDQHGIAYDLENYLQLGSN